MRSWLVLAVLLSLACAQTNVAGDRQESHSPSGWNHDKFEDLELDVKWVRDWDDDWRSDDCDVELEIECCGDCGVDHKKDDDDDYDSECEFKDRCDKDERECECEDEDDKDEDDQCKRKDQCDADEEECDDDDRCDGDDGDDDDDDDGTTPGGPDNGNPDNGGNPGGPGNGGNPGSGDGGDGDGGSGSDCSKKNCGKGKCAIVKGKAVCICERGYFGSSCSQSFNDVFDVSFSFRSPHTGEGERDWSRTFVKKDPVTIDIRCDKKPSAPFDSFGVSLAQLSLIPGGGSPISLLDLDGSLSQAGAAANLRFQSGPSSQSLADALTRLLASEDSAVVSLSFELQDSIVPTTPSTPTELALDVGLQFEVSGDEEPTVVQLSDQTDVFNSLSDLTPTASNPQASSSSSKLATGALVAIIVCSILALLAIIAITVVCVRRNKAQPDEQKKDGQLQKNAVEPVSPTPSQAASPKTAIHHA